MKNKLNDADEVKLK